MNVSLGELRDAFHIPKEWILLERTLLLLLGVCTTLDPEMNPTDVIEPYLERFLLGEKKQWSEVVVEATREMALAALSLPGELQRFMNRALRGDLELRVRNLEDNARLLYYGGQQILWGMLTAAAAGLAVLFDGRGHAGRRLGGRHRDRGVRAVPAARLAGGPPAARPATPSSSTKPIRRGAH